MFSRNSSGLKEICLTLLRYGILMRKQQQQQRQMLYRATIDRTFFVPEFITCHDHPLVLRLLSQR